MGKYIGDSLKLIADKLEKEEDVVIRIETSSGSVEPRKIKVLSVEDDYLVGHGRKQLGTEPENFSFAHISNWRFAKYNAEEWRKP